MHWLIEATSCFRPGFTHHRKWKSKKDRRSSHTLSEGARKRRYTPLRHWPVPHPLQTLKTLHGETYKKRDHCYEEWSRIPYSSFLYRALETFHRTLATLRLQSAQQNKTINLIHSTQSTNNGYAPRHIQAFQRIPCTRLLKTKKTRPMSTPHHGTQSSKTISNFNGRTTKWKKILQNFSTRKQELLRNTIRFKVGT